MHESVIDRMRAQIDGWAETLGGWTLRAATRAGELFAFAERTLRAGVDPGWLRSAAVVHVAIRQIYFTGVQAAPWLLAIGALGGGYAVMQIVRFARQLGDLTLIGRMVSGLIAAELAPLVVVVFLLARSGVAVAAEIGGMQLRREPLLLHALGIPPTLYLCWTRVVGFVVAGLVLSALFVVVAVWIGALWAALADLMPMADFMHELRRSGGWLAWLMLPLKGALYPALAIWMLLARSLEIGDDPNLVPVRASQGVLGAIAAILVFEVVLGLLLGAIG